MCIRDSFRSEPTAEYPDGRLVYRDKLDQDTPPRDVTVLLDDIIGERLARGRTRIARARARDAATHSRVVDPPAGSTTANRESGRATNPGLLLLLLLLLLLHGAADGERGRTSAGVERLNRVVSARPAPHLDGPAAPSQSKQRLSRNG